MGAGQDAAARSPGVQIAVSRLGLFVWTAIALVGLAGIGREFGALAAGVPSPAFGWQLIWLEGEANLPSWLSTQLLLAAALLLLVQYLAVRGTGDARFWLLLSIGFFYLSADEGAQLHERIQLLLPPMSDWLTFAWVIVAVPAVLVIGAAFLPFLLRLPPRTRFRFILAGAIYLSGAIGVEMVGGRFMTYGGPHSPYYVFAFVVEESLEFIGIGLFVTGVARHLAANGTVLSLRFR